MTALRKYYPFAIIILMIVLVVLTIITFPA